jgi:hypothetical protein
MDLLASMLHQLYMIFRKEKKGLYYVILFYFYANYLLTIVFCKMQIAWMIPGCFAEEFELKDCTISNFLGSTTNI